MHIDLHNLVFQAVRLLKTNNKESERDRKSARQHQEIISTIRTVDVFPGRNKAVSREAKGTTTYLFR
jgi:hypothetical protein